MINLQELILFGNSLDGEIPSSVLNNKNLNKIDLSNNIFNRKLYLRVSVTHQNSLKGKIPSEIGNCVSRLSFHICVLTTFNSVSLSSGFKVSAPEDPDSKTIFNLVMKKTAL
ncbi:hypothetical protein L2E82_46998 [Cichorium intybus]|uniref:Uncharacterized protein n=1 Tax=Cichorium intybus TaxID=13427 RepID=A0ACB8YYF1_CICIN|nr:hypothetical protein L2E82_46998 [Cichorium intybus]